MIANRSVRSCLSQLLESPHHSFIRAAGFLLLTIVFRRGRPTSLEAGYEVPNLDMKDQSRVQYSTSDFSNVER